MEKLIFRRYGQSPYCLFLKCFKQKRRIKRWQIICRIFSWYRLTKQCTRRARDCGVRKSMERISSRNIPLEIYHGVPKGWSRPELVSIHKSLGGTFPIAAVEATEPGAPSWMPDRYNWLQYRETLRGIAKGIKAGDSAC